MGYITKADLEEVFGADKLANWTGGDDAKITKAIENASAEIDGYLIKRYAVPLSRIPENIKNYCIDIALYNLLSLSVGSTGEAGDEEVKERAQKAIRFLEGVAKGTFSLPLPDEGGESKPPSGNILYKTQDKLDLEGYV